METPAAIDSFFDSHLPDLGTGMRFARQDSPAQRSDREAGSGRQLGLDVQLNRLLAADQIDYQSLFGPTEELLVRAAIEVFFERGLGV